MIDIEIQNSLDNFLNQIKTLSSKHQEIKKTLESIELKIFDLIHEIENGNYNVVEGYKKMKLLQIYRKQRRILKNMFNILSPLNEYLEKNKKIIPDLGKINSDMMRMKDKQINWTYEYRIKDDEELQNQITQLLS